MLDGVIAVCPRCGGEVPAVKSVKGLMRLDGDLVVAAWTHGDCGFMGRIMYRTEYFRETIAPALKWAARASGERPLTDEEKKLRMFVFDLEAVNHVGDLDLHWRAQKPSTIPLEEKRAEK